jgi:hypothetical protein
MFARIAVPVMVMAMVIVMMFMVVVMAVVFAAFRRRGQLAVKIRSHHRFHRRAGFAGADCDALLREKGDGTLANAAHDDHARALLADPAWEKPRHVFRRRHRPGVENFLLFWIRLHKRKLSAAAKVSVKPAFG